MIQGAASSGLQKLLLAEAVVQVVDHYGLQIQQHAVVVIQSAARVGLLYLWLTVAVI